MNESSEGLGQARTDRMLGRLAKNFSLSPEWTLILVLALLKLTIHFLTNTNYELHRDAFLYLALGDHLDFGYFSVPPLIAVFARLSGFLFGDSVFAVRLFPALIGAFSVVIIGMIVREFGGKRWAILLAGAAFILSPAFLRSNTLFQPVSFNQFYWLLASYFAVKLVRTKNPEFWIHLSIVFGLGFLNKYSIAFLALAFLISLALTPDRKLLASKHFLTGVLVGFLLILPNLIWQFNHDWPVVTHMRRLQETQLIHVNVTGFLIMQVLMNLPVIMIWLFGLIYLLFFKDGQDYRVLGYTFLAVLLILIVLRGKPYYTLGIYSLLFAAGGYAIERYSRPYVKWAGPLILALMIEISIPVIPYSLPVLPAEKMIAYGEASKKFGLAGALRWEDGRLHRLPQDYADMIGWEELSDIVIQTYAGLSETEKARCAIYAENYGQAGAIKHFGKKHGLPEPVSFHGSFLFWAPDTMNITTLIYVNDELGEDIVHHFAVVEPVGELANPYARERGLRVYLCQQPRNSFGDFYREKVKRLRGK